MKNALGIIRKIYEDGGNIIQYLKNSDNPEKNIGEMIRISYDFQSGSYIKNVKENPEYNEKYTRAIAKVINRIGIGYDFILEAGVGEATTLLNVIPKLKIKPKRAYGFDLAWSRIRYATQYRKRKNIKNVFLFMADLFNIPLADDSIDIVYTSHSIEPNGGKEREALLELMRITRRYLILLEPAYEFASAEAKKRMRKHGYIKTLYPTAISLGLNVIEHRLFDVYSNPLNPTGLIVIKKDVKSSRTMDNPLLCPVSKTPLERIKNSYFSKEGLLVYPVIDGVPCLLRDNAVIATHYTDTLEDI